MREGMGGHLNSTNMDQYSLFSKFLIIKPNTSLIDLLASVYHLALKKNPKRTIHKSL